MPAVVQKGRERWSSRIAFIMASIGAAIGYGNIWRFPSLVYKYGGGAFFIPYLLALFIIGIPVLTLETALGQVYQSGDMGTFGAIHKRFRGLGLISAMNAFYVVTYYNGLLAWTIRSFFDAFANDIWKGEGDVEPYSYFIDTIIGMSTLQDNLYPTRMVWPNVGCLALAWILVFLCLAFGIKNEGRITYFTCGFPFLLIFVFLGISMNLEGSKKGVEAYIGLWDMSVLSTMPEIWSTAVTQIFFSIGATYGIMTAFGSHCDKNAPAFANSCIIAISDSIFAVIAGFATFAMAGYVADYQGKEIDELGISGPGLVFGMFPTGLATLNNGGHLVRLFFFFLFLLGIDSAFALTEAALTVLHDTAFFNSTRRPVLAAGLCLIAFLCGLLYVTDAGLIFLDVVDFYINFIMILVGFFECFTAGWMYNIDKQIRNLGMPIVLSYMATTFGSVLIGSIIWTQQLVGGFIGLIATYVGGMVVVLFLCGIRADLSDRTWKSVLYELMLGNVFELRQKVADEIGFFPHIWAIMIKHVVPQLLLILFINLASAENSVGKPLFGHYESYLMFPFQFMGILIVALSLFLFSVGFAVPNLYNFLVYEDEVLTKADSLSETA